MHLPAAEIRALVDDVDDVDAAYARDRRVHVAQGLTAHQISDLLYLSTRTVETHVSRVLAKLGITSRSGVARRI